MQIILRDRESIVPERIVSIKDATYGATWELVSNLGNGKAELRMSDANQYMFSSICWHFERDNHIIIEDEKYRILSVASDNISELVVGLQFIRHTYAI